MSFPEEGKRRGEGTEEAGRCRSRQHPAAPVLNRVQGAKVEAVTRMDCAQRSLSDTSPLKGSTRKHTMDPVDPTPLRYLGELYPHDTGEWDKARDVSIHS